MRTNRGLWGCAFLSLLGVGLAGYLTFLHLGLLRGELLGGPACSGAGPFNCHVVTAGTWGSLLGMPLALWGVLGYLAVFALSLLGLQSSEWATEALPLIFVLAALFVGTDLILLGLMVFVIRFYCLFCLFTYAVNLALLVVSARSLGRPWTQALRQMGGSVGALVPSRQRPAAALFWGLVLVGILGTVSVHAATTFLSRGSFGSVRKQMREFVTRQPRVSVEIAGDPAIGPANAQVQIVEFSDFLCPACQRASKMNAIILANHRRDAVFVFKHFPLDSSCNDKISRMVHAGACMVAAASECAHLQGKFWAFHDLVFEQGQHYSPAHLETDMQRLGVDLAPFRACMESGQGLEAVKRDIAEAGKVGVGSTPTYVINGLPMAGGIQPTMFEDFLAVLREAGGSGG